MPNLSDFHPDDVKVISVPKLSDFSPEDIQAIPEDQYSKLGSAGMGALNQFGMAPPIAGAAQHPTGALKSLMGLLGKDESQDPDVQAYAKSRDESKAKFDAAEKDNPKSYLGGNLVGGLVPAFLTGGASEEGAAAQGLSKLLGGRIGANTASNVITGAGYGALSGVGSSNADLTKGQNTQLLGDVAKNAALGGAIGPIVGKVSNALSPESLENAAAKKAVSATGVTKGQAKTLAKAPAAEEGGNRLLEQGKNLLSKNEYTQTPVVTPFAGGEEMLDRANTLAEKSGKHIGDLLGELDNKFTDTPEIQQSFVNPANIAAKVQELQQQFVKNGAVVPLYKGEYNKLQDALETINQYGNNPIPFSEANQLKQIISKSAYGDNGKLEDQLMGQVRGIVNDSIEDSADEVAKASGDPEILNKYMNAKEYYRTAKDAINSLQGKVAGSISNRDLGITDYMTGMGGALAHGVPGGALAVAGNKLWTTYGNSITASTLKTGANVSSAVNKAFTSAPQAIGVLGKTLSSSANPLENRLGRVLVQASEKDDIGRNALIFSLMQNPEYRSMMKDLMNHKEEPTE